MTVKELIHRLTDDTVDLNAEVFYVDVFTDENKEYPVSSFGYDMNKKKVLLNNTY